MNLSRKEEVVSHSKSKEYIRKRQKLSGSVHWTHTVIEKLCVGLALFFLFSITLSTQAMAQPADYCLASGTSTSSSHISLVALQPTTPSLANPAEGGFLLAQPSGNDGGYINFTAFNAPPEIEQGALVHLLLSGGILEPSSPPQEWSVWVDLDQNGTFDAEDLVFSETSSVGGIDSFFSIPVESLTGETRMRVIVSDDGFAPACGSFESGEVEDYTIDIQAVPGPFYCDAFGVSSPSSHISLVELQQTTPSLANPAGGDFLLVQPSGNDGGYINFTAFNAPPEIEQGALVHLLLSGGTLEPSSPPQEWSVWVDLDQNGTFDAEDLVFSETSSVGGIDSFFSIPVESLSGETRMRVIVSDDGFAPACGSFESGEVEDYTIDIQAVPGPFYCDAFGVSSPSSHISLVELQQTTPSLANPAGGDFLLVQPSGNDGGYINFTAFNAPPEIEQGALVHLLLSGGTLEPSSPPQEWSVWVDLDQNGTFDAEDLVFSETSSVGGIDSFFSIPVESLSGETRMRVIVSDDGLAPVCGSFESGEVEDYTIDIQAVPGPFYCDAFGVSSPSSHISLVELQQTTPSLANPAGGDFLLVQPSGNDGGYINFTAFNAPPEIEQGALVHLLLSGGTLEPSSPPQEWSVWVDLDQNGTFDAEDLVFSETSSVGGIDSFFSIPVESLSGETRMRVIVSDDGLAPVCGSFEFGEVEDYSIQIVAVPGNNAICGNGIVEPGEECDDGNQDDSDSCTKNCTLNGGKLSYCPSQGGNVSYEWIEAIQVGSLSNMSGANGGYADFTTLAAPSAQAGETMSVTLAPGFGSSTYTERWRIWIDTNQDGSFDDTTELVFQGSSNDLVTGKLTIPANALSGTTRMRISMKWGGAPSSCGSFRWGEVEDYSITISRSSPKMKRKMERGQ